MLERFIEAQKKLDEIKSVLGQKNAPKKPQEKKKDDKKAA